jgi:3-carboxy-cis,cis-muconate cycloisomerase
VVRRSGWPCSSAARQARSPRSAIAAAGGGLLAEELGLALPVLPWHTDRLRIIDLAAALARTTAALGKIARDVTLLAQSEVGEVSEGARRTGAGPGRAALAGPASAPRRGGSSAMPNKHNPVASIAILGCTRQVAGLLATLVAAAEQEHQRAAGAWHAEWEPLTALLRLTGSAASWAAELLSGLTRGHLADGRQPGRDQGPAARGARHLAAGRGARRRPGARPGGRGRPAGGQRGLPLRDVLLAVPKLEGRLASAGITPEQIESALEPAGYLGATDAFVTAALAAHEALDAQLSKEEMHHG